VYASGKGSVYGLSLNLWREQNIRSGRVIFRPKSLVFFFFFFWISVLVVVGFFECLFAHMCERAFQKYTQRADGLIFQEDFSRSRYYYTL
jgi:hypothetical protein